MKKWTVLLAAGPIGLIIVYVLLSLASSPKNHYADAFWVLFVPSYLGGKIFGLFVAWLAISAISFLAYLVLPFKKKVLLSSLLGVVIYFVLAVSISTRMIVGAGGF